MTALTITLAGAALIAVLVAVFALIALRRVRAAARREAAELRERLETLEAGLGDLRRAALDRRTGVVPADHEFVITHLGEPDADALDACPATAAPVRLSGPAFADAVVRETVVQAASLVQGLRRALAPETRNRIRFEMKREVKRSRKERKAEVREALREYRARRRSAISDVEDLAVDTRADAQGAA